MRFLRAFTGGVATAVIGLAAVGAGGWRLADALLTDTQVDAAAPRERAFAVAVGVIEPQTVAPRIDSYGWVRSARQVTLASRVGGRVTEVGDGVRPGVTVAEGALLLRIDPTDRRAALEVAEAEAAEARLARDEAMQRVALARAELETAQERHALRASSAERRRALAERGVAALSAVDAAELGLLSAADRLDDRRRALLAAELAVARAALAVDRAALQVARARRTLRETEIRAPFDGVVARLDVGLGDLVRPIDDLGLFIDPQALEIAFPVTSDQFARLTAPDGAMAAAPVRVWRDPDRPGGALDRAPDADAVLDRASANAATDGAGRRLIARVIPAEGGAAPLKPGDFVGVALEEPPLDGVARLPASAVGADGRILVVDEADRLRAAPVRVVRHEGEHVVVDAAPFGARYVLTRSWRLGEGLLAAPRAAFDGGAAPPS